MKLNEKIKILRKARGLSQQELGDRLSKSTFGLSRQSISDWENGNSEPKLDNIRDLANVLNVSFNTLLDDKIDLNDTPTLMAALNNENKLDSKKDLLIYKNIYRSHFSPIILFFGLIVATLIIFVKKVSSIELDTYEMSSSMTIMGGIEEIKNANSVNNSNFAKLYTLITIIAVSICILIGLVVLFSKIKPQYKIAVLSPNGIYLNRRNKFISTNDIIDISIGRFSFRFYGSIIIKTSSKKIRLPLILNPYQISKFFEIIKQ